MTNREIDSLIFTGKNAGYNAAYKAKYRSLSMKLIRELNKLLNADADTRYNAGGIAVSGESTLHSDKIYIQVQGDSSMQAILVRACTSKADYAGGPNKFYSFDRLREFGVEGLAQFAAQIISPTGRRGVFFPEE